MNFGFDVNTLVFLSFLLCAVPSLFLARLRMNILSRSKSDWTIDLSGLLIQGLLIPLLQTTLLFGMLKLLLPNLAGTWNLRFLPSFLLNFVCLDYLYYLNHRFLHRPKFWPIHFLHHTAKQMDVFMTSRNSIWSSFFIVYLWVNGLFIYFLKDPSGVLLGAALTASLDLWRHSTIAPARCSVMHRLLASFLITPHEHAMHHSAQGSLLNYGANLSLWDKLHHSYRFGSLKPRKLGIPQRTESIWTNLFLPWQSVSRFEGKPSKALIEE